MEIIKGRGAEALVELIKYGTEFGIEAGAAALWALAPFLFVRLCAHLSVYAFSFKEWYDMLNLSTIAVGRCWSILLSSFFDCYWAILEHSVAIL